MTFHFPFTLQDTAVEPSDVGRQSSAKDLAHPIFRFSWASDSQLAWLDRRMGELGRQRMNLRLMKSARFLLLQNTADQIIGWGGVDTEFNPIYPELFSLNLEPAYRKLGLGLLLEFMRATYLRDRKIPFAFVRMDKDTSYKLLLKRIESRFYSVLPPETLDPNYLRLCQNCELFQKSCQKQIFLRFNVLKFIEAHENQFRGISWQQLPAQFKLEPQLASTWQLFESNH